MKDIMLQSRPRFLWCTLYIWHPFSTGFLLGEVGGEVQLMKVVAVITWKQYKIWTWL